MENDNIDNEKLLLEIDSLEDNSEQEGGIKNKNGGNKWIIILVLIAMLGLTSLYFNYNYEYDYDYEYDYEDMDYYEDEYSDEEIKEYISKEYLAKEKFTKQKNNIKIENISYGINKELIATITNDNEEPITDLKVEVIFYDGENKPIEIDEDTIGVIEKNSQCYIKFEETPENFERYEFLISREYYWYDNLTYVTKNVSYEVVENDDYAELKVKNNSSEEISEVDFQITYYNEENKIINVENIGIFDLEKRKTQTEEFCLYEFNEKEETYEDYARYEVKLLGAYIY